MHANTQKVFLQFYPGSGADWDMPREYALKMASEIAEARDVIRQMSTIARHVIKHGSCSSETRVNVTAIYDHALTFLEIYDKA